MSTIQMFPVESSNIAALGFDHHEKTLIAEFKSGDLYLYDAVPQETFGAVLAAESKGKAFNDLIKKGGFQYRKVDARPV